MTKTSKSGFFMYNVISVLTVLKVSFTLVLHSSVKLVVALKYVRADWKLNLPKKKWQFYFKMDHGFNDIYHCNKQWWKAKLNFSYLSKTEVVKLIVNLSNCINTQLGIIIQLNFKTIVYQRLNKRCKIDL